MSARKKSIATVVATAKARIAEAETQAFVARAEAIDEILRGASAFDAMMICANILAEVVPDCCEIHRDEFREEFLKMLADRVAAREDDDDDDGEDNAPPPIH